VGIVEWAALLLVPALATYMFIRRKSPPNELIRKVSIEEVEENLRERSEPGAELSLFVPTREAWDDLLSQMLPGDEIWEFSSSPESWERLCGSAGLVLIRDGRKVTTLLTVIN
jgi:hypothetical protein